MACQHKKSCDLYPQFISKGSLKVWKILYCEDDRKVPRCARYKLALESRPVPLNLLPNGDKLDI